jgi:hypothetical protein
LIKTNTISNLEIKSKKKDNLQQNSQSTSSFNTDLDYIYLYFIKFKANVIYDCYLTVNVYRSLRLSKAQRNFTYFNLKNLFIYIIHTFYILSKLKDFTIELEWKNNNIEETFGIYDYYRVIIFNLLNFIINNSLSENKNKKINIIVDVVRFQQQDYIFKVEFEIYDDKVNYISYTDLKRILEVTDIFNLNQKEIEKFYLFDIGIFVAYNLLQKVYSGEFTISTHQFGTKLTFFIKGEAILTGGSIFFPVTSTIFSKSLTNKIKIELPKTKLEQQYYKFVMDKILQKPSRRSFFVQTKYIDNGKYDICNITLIF